MKILKDNDRVGLLIYHTKPLTLTLCEALYDLAEYTPNIILVLSNTKEENDKQINTFMEHFPEFLTNFPAELFLVRVDDETIDTEKGREISDIISQEIAALGLFEEKDGVIETHWNHISVDPEWPYVQRYSIEEGL